MKSRCKLLSVVLASAMVLSSALPAFAAPAADEYHVELEKVGELSGDDYRVSYNSFIESAGDDKAYIYDVNGNKIFSEAVRSSDYLERGMYQYSKADTEDVNRSALVSADGKVLVPFECAFFEWPGAYHNKTQNRYILAFYGTEETDNQDEMLFYTTDDYIAVGGPGKDDTMYKGYVKIFDIQENRFVEGLQFEQIDKYDTVNIVGNSLLIQNADKTYTLYDADGKKILDLSDRSDFNSSVIIERSETGSGSRVFDENGTEIYKSEGRLSTFSSTSNYLYVYDSGKYTVFDSHGKQVLDTPFDYITSESFDIYKIREDDAYVLYDAAGKELGRTEGSCDEIGYGRYVLETGVKTYTMTGPSGTLAEGLKEESYGTIYTNEGSIACYNDGTGFLAYDDNASYRVYNNCLLYVDPGNGDSPALYDMYSGKKLLDDGFSYASNLGDRIVLEYRNGSSKTYKTFDINVAEGK